MKTQKVQIQQKMKQESEQFRLWKASREKEVLQLKKEGRRNIYELHKIQALHLRQKMVLQRKTEEAATAMRRLKELQEARKSSKDTAPNGTLLLTGPSSQNNEKSLQHWLEQELEMALRVHEVRSAVEKQREERAATAKELMELRQQDDEKLAIANDPDEESNARHARIAYLESLLSSSSGDMVAMASQLSEAEERERACSGRARWQHLRSMGDAKTLLHLMFGVASYSRCRFKDLEDENKEMKEKLAEVEGLLKQTEAQRQELERQNLLTNQALSVALVAASKYELDVRNTQTEGDRPRKSGGPYDLRKVSRVSSIVRTSLPESDMDLSDSESEFDMRADVSDLDSDFDEDEKSYKRRVARKTQSGTRVLSGGRKQASVGQKSSTDLPHSEPPSEPGSAESGRITPSSGATTPAEVKEELKSGHCCSCSPWSGCKTKKCACKAVGGFCGPACGCKVGRCANRGEIDTVESSLVTTNSLVPAHRDMAVAMAGLRVDETSHKLGFDFGDSKTGVELSGGPSPETDSALLKKVVTLLDFAWKSSQQGSPQSPDEHLHPGEVVFHGTRDETRKDEVGSKRPRRPLSDIGNNKILTKPHGDRPPLKTKRKVPRGLVQLVSVPSLAPEQPAATPSSTPTATVPAPAIGYTAADGNSLGSADGGYTLRSVGDRPAVPETQAPSNNSAGYHVTTSAGERPGEPLVPPRVHPSLPRSGHGPLKIRSDSSLQNSEVDASTSNGRRKDTTNGHGRNSMAGDQKENMRTNSRRL